MLWGKQKKYDSISVLIYYWFSHWERWEYWASQETMPLTTCSLLNKIISYMVFNDNLWEELDKKRKTSYKGVGWSQGRLLWEGGISNSSWHMGNAQWIYLKINEPWPVWLSWLGTVPQSKRSPVQFPCKGCRLGPWLGCMWEATDQCFCPLFLLPLPSL